MTQHTLCRLRAGALALGLGVLVVLVPGTGSPAAAAADPRPLPCVRPAPIRATTTPADDKAAAQAANDARRTGLQDRYPDRQLSTYSTLSEIGEGWRYGWKVGRMRHVAFLNRAGAMLVGTVFAPDPARCPGRRPAVLVTEGITANEVLYWWQAQSLAEAGYVVLTFDYMNQGLSEANGHDAKGARVPPVGGDRGTDPATGFLQDSRDALDFLLSSPARPYAHTGPRLATDGPFDAANPFAAQVDPRYVGLTGHSEGARVASVLQGIDPRPGAVVALDNLATRLKGDPGSSNSQCVEGGIGTDTLPVVPRVPAMGQAAPNNTVCRDPELKKFAYQRWRAAGIPAVQVVVSGARHADWSPTPAVSEGNADVPELAAYWTTAWFDRWLLQDPTAELRVLSRSFDLFDHYTGPFRRTAAEVLDPTFTSSAATGTNSCPDLRVACVAVLPRVPAAREGRDQEEAPGGSPRGEPADPQVGTSGLVGAPRTAAVPLVAGRAPSGSPAPLISLADAPLLQAASPRTGTGALVALPLSGAVMGLMVLVGFRRHEARARGLGALAP